MFRFVFLAALWTTVATFAGALQAAEPVTLDNVETPAANSADEPLAAYSLERAVHFLDSASLAWQKDRKCFTCHTNYAYLYARPAVDAESDAHQIVRRFAEELVTERWQQQGPRWDAEVVATAAALAFNDASTSGRLHPATRAALDRMWTVQQEHGGWNWLKCDWPPMESDDHYGATLAAIAVGVAPEKYAGTEVAQRGMERVREYFRQNAPPTLHHRAMLLWAASYQADLLAADEKEATIAELRELQNADGGWVLATLGDWKRGDDSPQDRTSSDGYATGFVVFVLRQSGVAADDPALVRGVQWLKANQRESGRWYTRSLHADSRHYISHAGSAFAVMALEACNALE